MMMYTIFLPCVVSVLHMRRLPTQPPSFYRKSLVPGGQVRTGSYKRETEKSFRRETGQAGLPWFSGPSQITEGPGGGKDEREGRKRSSSMYCAVGCKTEMHDAHGYR